MLTVNQFSHQGRIRKGQGFFFSQPMPAEQTTQTLHLILSARHLQDG
jgi:EAL domain-containing protein (putative c-di-GMP-specific phosphodiesterase class I)